MAEPIENIKDVIRQAHAVTADTFEKAGTVPGELVNEYSLKISQFQNMYQSIESMKAIAKEMTLESLEKQELVILQNWLDYERSMQERVNSCCSG